MSDIFDELEKTIAADKSDSEHSSIEKELEEVQSFNDSELEDIMAEIESLESDYEMGHQSKVVGDEALAKSNVHDLHIDSQSVVKTDLQKAIDNEIASLDTVHKMMSNSQEVKTANVPKESMDKINSNRDFKMENTQMKNEESSMSFSAIGNMNFNLAFKIGEQEAKLFIDQGNGVTLTFSGVELSINENHGCTVVMNNGINFNIPLTTKESQTKKKAA